jgi:hypothetical protein
MHQELPTAQERAIEHIIRLGHSRARWRLASVALAALLVGVALGRL